MAKPKKEPLTVIELTSKRSLPEYITLGAEDLDAAKAGVLKRKKVRVAPGVSFSFVGIRLVPLNHLKKEG